MDADSKEIKRVIEKNNKKLDFYTNDESMNKMFENFDSSNQSDKRNTAKEVIKNIFKTRSLEQKTEKPKNRTEDVAMIDNIDMKSKIKRIRFTIYLQYVRRSKNFRRQI